MFTKLLNFVICKQSTEKLILQYLHGFAENAAPPVDVGGVHGFKEFGEVIADPKIKVGALLR